MNPSSETTRLILVRHGETEWNLEGRMMGHRDSPLTPLGREQARRLGERLAQGRFEALYCSDLTRARSTAEIIGAISGHTVVTEVRLRERGLGIFEGLTLDETAVRHPDERVRFEAGNFDYAMPGAESNRQMVTRVKACLEELVERHKGKTFVAVSHGGAIAVFLTQVLGMAPGSEGRFRKANAAFNSFRWRAGQWTLECWGDVSHLEGAVVE